MAEADSELGFLFAQACLSLLKNANLPASAVRAIGSHGQTIQHQPNAKIPYTLQIGDPNIIAAKTGITTVADFRRRDIALGGQGAPLTPAFHHYVFADLHENNWVINIGGIANVSFLPANQDLPILGFDIGPGNTLLDSWCYKHRQQSYDANGLWAASGKIIPALLEKLLQDSYFHQSFPKSTGRDYFNLSWLNHFLEDAFAPQDVQATLLELTARTIFNAINSFNLKGSIWICGGGAENNTLLARLSDLCRGFKVATTEGKGLHPKWVEATAFAWLARQTLLGKPGNLPSVTGAHRLSVTGAIYLAEKIRSSTLLDSYPGIFKI